MYLTTLDQGLVRLEKESQNRELLDELYRAAHTLKGTARMMGFGQIGDIAHKIEDLLGLIKENKLALQPTIVDTVFSALDLIKTAVDNIAQGKEEGITVGEVCENLGIASLK